MKNYIHRTKNAQDEFTVSYMPESKKKMLKKYPQL